jgi:hypothetical protein
VTFCDVNEYYIGMVRQCGGMSYVGILPTGLSMELQYEVQQSKKHDGISPLSPLVDNSAVL